MDFSKIFRIRLFGGYNREDVDGYIKELENKLADQKIEGTEAPAGQIQSLQEQVSSLLKENQKIKDENRDQQEKIRKLQVESQKKVDEPLEKSAAAETGREQELSRLQAENIRLAEKIRDMEKKNSSQDEDKLAIARVLKDARERADQIVLKANEQADRIHAEAKEEAARKLESTDEQVKKELTDKAIRLAVTKYKLEGDFRKIDESYRQIFEATGRMKEIMASVSAVYDRFASLELSDQTGKEKQADMPAGTAAAAGNWAEEQVQRENGKEAAAKTDDRKGPK